MWEAEKLKELWDHKKKMNVDKLVEKSPSTPLIERYMMKYKNLF